MRPDRSDWLGTLSTGLVWGGVAVFLALVGVVGTFAGREIVAGVVSLGHTVLYATGSIAGYQAARRHTGTAAVLLHGILSGVAWGAVVAALAFAGHLWNLRAMFINASPELFALLTFGRGISGASLQLLAGPAAGVVGAAILLVPAVVRRPVFVGLAWVLFFGLFQELLGLLLAEGDIQSAIRGFLFTGNGLTTTAAIVLFLVASVASAVLRGRGAAARRRAPASPERRRILRRILLGIGVVVVLLAPRAGGLFLSQVLVLVGLYIVLGLGLNIVVGFAGLLDLGFVAFFAIGAYTVGLLTSTAGQMVLHLNFWEAVPFAVIVALAFGVMLGLPVLRIRGDYLAIATLGFGEIIRLLVLSDFLRPWLGGSQGVLAIPKPMIGSFEFAGPMQLVYLTIAASAIVAFVAVRLRDSRLGRAWMAAREDEDVAEAMGINLVNVKLLAYGLGAAFGGMSGAIFAVMVGSVFPHSFNIIISINVLALIIVGGMGSLPGVAVGSLFLVGLPELLREFAEFRFLIYGAALILMMQLRPEGLWPEAVRRRELHDAEPGVPAAADALASPGVPGEA